MVPEETKTHADAFISYSREDSEFALRLARDLRDAGAAIWIDQIDIQAGDAWDNAIEDALVAAPRLILVLSPSSARSSNVRNEISFAIEQGKTVIPVLYKDCTVPLQLQRAHRIDFREDYAGALHSLLARLKITAPAEEQAHQTPVVDAVSSPLPTAGQSMRASVEKRQQKVRSQEAKAFAAPSGSTERSVWSGWRTIWLGVTGLAVIAAVAALGWRLHERHWAQWEAPGEIAALQAANKNLEAFDELHRALRLLPDDATLKHLAAQSTMQISVTSTPAQATVEIQDYLVPGGEWHNLGVTPLKKVTVPNGYFRWRITVSGKQMLAAPFTDAEMTFDFAANEAAPAGMAYAPGGRWSDYVGFLGWLGPYDLPPYDIDKLEVTNAQFQAFVDGGGYEKAEFWPATIQQNGHDTAWSNVVAGFRDTTGRPGPSTWVGGHFPPGRGDYPVGGLSWYEAVAYAAFVHKSLPVLSQWYLAAPPELARFTVLQSNFASNGLQPAGASKGLGPFGTDDMAGNVREWTANGDDTGLRYILGGDWKSPMYLYSEPEAVLPMDRSESNGIRCVRNITPAPAQASLPIKRISRDFTNFKTVPDDVFRAYQQLYAYPQTPLNAQSDGVVQETEDWREEKVEFDTAYGGERMAAYLFLPKNAHAPYQTVLFSPSARVWFEKDSSHLADLQFFDYIVQSGRAVIYPVYSGLYERKHRNIGAAELLTENYKDAARSLDYLATRKDFDMHRVAYLGVSMGAAYGVTLTSLLQDRLKTAVFLDGGYFLEQPQPGSDPADFAVRMKDPVLMVNGRYDFSFPLDTSQNPLFEMLGTGTADKKHVVLDTSHDVTQAHPQLVQAVLNWLDKYLGRVQ